VIAEHEGIFLALPQYKLKAKFELSLVVGIENVQHPLSGSSIQRLPLLVFSDLSRNPLVLVCSKL